MKRAAFAIFCLALLGGCENAEDSYLVGTLERDRIELPAELSEPVLELHVSKGQFVRAGEPLLQLDDTRARAELDRLQAQREQAQRRVDELVRGPRSESIREAQARLEGASGRVQAARHEYERIRSLHEEGLASATALDNARAAFDTAASEEDAARAALDALLEGTTVEELDQARAQLEAARAAVDAQAIIVDRLSIEAPRDAVVESLPWKTGSQPPRGATVAVLLASGAPFTRTYVPVNQRARFTVGAKVEIHVPGFGDFPGRVRWVSGDAAFTPYFALTEHDRDRLSHAAEIDLAGDAANELPAGLPVEVRPARNADEQ